MRIDDIKKQMIENGQNPNDYLILIFENKYAIWKKEIAPEILKNSQQIAKQESEIIAKPLRLASQIATRDKIKAGELKESEIVSLVDIYDRWETGINYQVGDVISYNNNLHEVIQAHTSQANWHPEIATSLFKSHAPSGVVLEWVQPTGSHDAYKIGDNVLFEGKTYESLIDANTWSPSAYPAGWQEIV